MVRVLSLMPTHDATLAALDALLWTFEAQAFVPHLRIAGADAASCARTPIWLAESIPAGEHPRVLVNLGAAPPPRADDFDRVIEVVGADEAARADGRARWRHYERWGAPPLHHPARAG